jgi:hypothetical protein
MSGCHAGLSHATLSEACSPYKPDLSLDVALPSFTLPLSLLGAYANLDKSNPVEFPLSLMNKNMINMTYLYYFILV